MKSISSIEAKFRRFNLHTNFTKLWREKNEVEKKEILNNIQLLMDETAILVFHPKDSYFWVLTQTRLIVCENHKPTNFLISDLKFVDLRDLFPNGIPFNALEKLSFLHNGEKLEVVIEKGTWHVMYSLFLFLFRGRVAGIM